MKRPILNSLLIFLGFLALLYPEKPLREYLAGMGWLLPKAKLAAGLFVRIISIALAVRAMHYFKTISFTGFLLPFRGKNYQAIVLALVIIGFGIYGNLDTYRTAPPVLLLLFCGFVLAVGILEELIFRGLIFPLFAKASSGFTRPFVVAAISSGLLFGMIHFVNLLEQPQNWQGITSQVFFAMSIGVYFSGLLLRTENIWWPILIHALVNFSFGAGILNETATELMPEVGDEEWSWSKIIPTTIFFTFIFAGGLYMLLKSNIQKMYFFLAQD